MRKLVSFFAIALLAATAAKAQTSGAVQIGSMTVTVPVSSIQSPTVNPYQASTSTSDYIGEVLILRTSTGQIEYAMKASNIQIVGSDGSTIDGIATEQVMTKLAEAAVAQGYLYGYVEADANSKVWSENCVVRTGSGVYTRFAPCSSTTRTCYNGYTVSESPQTYEPVVTQENSCPDCTPTVYTVSNTVQ